MIDSGTALAYLKVDPGDAQASIVLATLDRILSWVETETGRYFREPREFRLRFDGGGDSIWLPEKPIMDGESDPAPILMVEQLVGGAWVEIAGANYELLEQVMPYGPYPLAHVTAWPHGRRNIRVTFTAGYDELPLDIVQFVLRFTALRYRERGNEGLKSETIGGYSYTRGDLSGDEGLRDDWGQILSKWHHAVFA